MLFTLIACCLSVFVAANPFHKYPYVFLLDVGNEELEKTNSEQIRLSVPGGSVALRYPAIGSGDTIGHIRVSGIDFGTDLKASIVDGGPGNKYFVLVFMGNPGVAYDAVITVQTVDDSASDPSDSLNKPEIEEELNNSAEDLSDDSQDMNKPQSTSYIEKTNSEIMQSSSNVYKYAQNEATRDDYDEDTDTHQADLQQQEAEDDIDENNDESDSPNQKDIHISYYNDDAIPETPVQANVDSDDQDEEEISSDNDYSENAEAYNVLNDNQYMKYKALEPHLNYEGQVYSIDELQKSGKPVYQEDPLDYEEPEGQVFNEREQNDDFNNNNYIDNDDSYAVAY